MENTENVIDAQIVETPKKPQTVDEKIKIIADTINTNGSMVNDLIKDLTAIKIDLANLGFRFDTLLRYLLTTGKFTTDDMLNSLDKQNVFLTNLTRINALPTVLERVTEATAYNLNNDFKISADDLNVLAALRASGGTKQSVIDTILTLPHSERLATNLKDYV